MDIVTQILFIGYALLNGASAFATVGRKPSYVDFRRGMSLLVWIFGLFTIAFLLWWDPATIAETIAMWATITLMWLPWLIGLPNLASQTWDPQPTTVRGAVLNMIIAAVRIGLVLGFWII